MTPLSTVHISPDGDGYVRLRPDVKYRAPRFRYHDGGSLIEAQHEHYNIHGRRHPATGVIRGSITQFTRKSKKRLMNFLGTLNTKELPHFVTLTYPDEYTADARTWKKDLDNFDKRLARKFPKSAMIWKLEPQKRGAPHYHLLVWGVSLHDLMNFVPFAWASVVGSSDQNHLLWHLGVLGNGNRHCVQKVRSWRGVRSYAAKYMGKVIDMPLMIESGWASPGRFWGVRRRDNLPAVVADIIPYLYDKTVYDLFRLMRRYAHVKARQYRSMSILTNNPSDWARCTKYLQYLNAEI